MLTKPDSAVALRKRGCPEASDEETRRPARRMGILIASF
jgi:hypothetical protein